jgi:hypothetical protein
VAGAACCALTLAACGAGSNPLGSGEFDPRIGEEFVKDKVVADVQANVAIDATEVEEPVVTCEQRQPVGEEPTDEGIFTCKATVDDTDGKTVGHETWEIGIEIDPQTSDSVVRSAERLKSTIGEAPQPTG